MLYISVWMPCMLKFLGRKGQTIVLETSAYGFEWIHWHVVWLIRILILFLLKLCSIVLGLFTTKDLLLWGCLRCLCCNHSYATFVAWTTLLDFLVVFFGGFVVVLLEPDGCVYEFKAIVLEFLERLFPLVLEFWNMWVYWAIAGDLLSCRFSRYSIKLVVVYLEIFFSIFPCGQWGCFLGSSSFHFLLLRQF
jgi:hypothetical protein